MPFASRFFELKLEELAARARSRHHRCAACDRLPAPGNFILGRGRRLRARGPDHRRERLGTLPGRPSHRACPGTPVRHEHLSAAVVVGLSFFAYRANRMKPPVFVGLANYENVITDPVVWIACTRLPFSSSLRFGADDRRLSVGDAVRQAVSAPPLFAHSRPHSDDAVVRRGRRLLPYYYEPTFGLLSQFVRLFTGEPYILLSSTAGAMAGIVFADAWMWSPFVMLLVLAGLVSVPNYLYEAAAIDRVSGWRRFWSITFPYIRGLLMLALLFRYDRGVSCSSMWCSC